MHCGSLNIKFNVTKSGKFPLKLQKNFIHSIRHNITRPKNNKMSDLFLILDIKHWNEHANLNMQT